MAITGRDVKMKLREAGSLTKYIKTMYEDLGIAIDPTTQKWYIDKSKKKIDTSEFHWPSISRELLGSELASVVRDGMNDSLADLFSDASHVRKNHFSIHKMYMEDMNIYPDNLRPNIKVFYEDAGVQPTVLQDVNAWTANVAGLLQVRMLEAYMLGSEDYISDRVCTTVPTIQNGFKMFQIMYPNPKAARFTEPGEDFPQAILSPTWVWCRPLKKLSLRLAIPAETVWADISGELMEKAEQVGVSLRYNKEYYIAGHVWGKNAIPPTTVFDNVAAGIADSYRAGTSTPDTASNPTYQSVAVTTNQNFYNYVNQRTSVDLVDYRDLQGVRNTLNLMRDPINSLPFDTDIRQLLVDTALLPVAQYIRHQMSVFRSTGTPATAPEQGAASTFPPILTQAPGVPPGAQNFDFEIMSSKIHHQLLIDAGVTDDSTHAQTYWIAGNLKKAFAWAQGWDLKVDQAPTTSAYLMKSGLVTEFYAQWFGQFMVKEPRYVVQNYHSA